MNTDAVKDQQLKKAENRELRLSNNSNCRHNFSNDGHTIYTVNTNDVALSDTVLKYSSNGTNTPIR